MCVHVDPLFRNPLDAQRLDLPGTHLLTQMTWSSTARGCWTALKPAIMRTRNLHHSPAELCHPEHGRADDRRSRQPSIFRKKARNGAWTFFYQ